MYKLGTRSSTVKIFCRSHYWQLCCKEMPREFELAAALWKIEMDMLRTRQLFSLSPNRMSYSYGHRSLILTSTWQRLPSSLEMFSLAKGKIACIFCDLMWGKSYEQYVPYWLGQTMVMARSILFYNLLDSINAAILTKAACSNNTENRVETKFECILPMKWFNVIVKFKYCIRNFNASCHFRIGL